MTAFLSDRRPSAIMQRHIVGAWRSPEAHLHGVQGVGGSNPPAPTYDRRPMVGGPLFAQAPSNTAPEPRTEARDAGRLPPPPASRCLRQVASTSIDGLFQESDGHR
jgi:hypothetical protein